MQTRRVVTTRQHFSRPRGLECAPCKPPDISKSRVDFSNNGSSQTRRVVKTRQHFPRPRRLQSLCAPHKPFFLSLSPPRDISKSRVDFSNDGSSQTKRVVTTRQHFPRPHGIRCTCAPHTRLFLKPLLHVETFRWNLCATALRNKFQKALQRVKAAVTPLKLLTGTCEQRRCETSYEILDLTSQTDLHACLQRVNAMQISFWRQIKNRPTPLLTRSCTKWCLLFRKFGSL